MSDQEKKGVSSAIGSSIVMVEQNTDGRHKQPYRPTELQDDNEMYQKRSKAPVVPSVAEELKHLNEDSANAIAEKRERKESEAMSSEKHKHAKKLSSNTKRRESSPESIPMSAIDVDKKRMLPPSQPIPPEVDAALSGAHDLPVEKDAPRKPDEDSITEEIAELRTPELEKKHSNWSDDEAAGGLPRSDSRSSRVSRMVRQFFCCGVAYEAPSEDNISDHRKVAI
ncbi:unnamed protein product [Danaus chrysippus]|uniref:(African queen) hypothetical protein n=1 Tax=Danaus chrysippus TaxID=151541 RepID=A0A8J2QHX6_9NEOP|nr:unnamed protein product [Danaus chrysippus]